MQVLFEPIFKAAGLFSIVPKPEFLSRRGAPV
jgi:hypothetical protein